MNRMKVYCEGGPYDMQDVEWDGWMQSLTVECQYAKDPDDTMHAGVYRRTGRTYGGLTVYTWVEFLQ